MHETPYAGFANNPILTVDRLGNDTAIYSKGTGKNIQTYTKSPGYVKKEGEKTPIFTVDENAKGYDPKNPINTATPLTYTVGAKTDFNGITGKSFRANHPLKDIGTKVGEQVYKEDLLDMTSEFDKLLFDGFKDFANVRFTSDQKTAYIWGKKTNEKFEAFYDLVQTDNKYDLKSKITTDGTASYAAISIGEFSIYNGQLLEYQDYGNISYGYFGRFSRISAGDLLYWSNYAQQQSTGTPDPTRDKNMIMQGKYLWDNQGEKKYQQWLLVENPEALTTKFLNKLTSRIFNKTGMFKLFLGGQYNSE